MPRAWHTAAIAVAATSSLVLGSDVAAPAAETRAGPREVVAVKGLCQGRAGYSATLTVGDQVVDLDVTVRGAGARKDWWVTTNARTTFANGESVEGIGHGPARSDRRGRITTGAATSVGLRHRIEVHLSRDDGKDRCVVVVRR